MVHASTCLSLFVGILGVEGIRKGRRAEQEAATSDESSLLSRPRMPSKEISVDQVKVWLTQVAGDARPSSLLKREPGLQFQAGQSLLQGASATAQRSAAGSHLGGTLECRKEGGHATKDCQVMPPEVAAKSTASLDVVQVQVNTSANKQLMYGFGAAMTHSSATVLMKLKQKNDALYRDVMDRLFGSSHAESAGITGVRIPVGSSDFAQRLETFDDVPPMPGCKADKWCDATCSMPNGACSSIVDEGEWAGQASACDSSGCGAHCGKCKQCQSCCCIPADWELERFGPLTHEIIEVLKDAKAINPELWLMGSPWTPPAWLKAKGTLAAITNDNTLIDDDMAYSTYAKYLAMLCNLFHVHGLPLSYITLQNEPLFGDANYPGMYLSAKQSVRLGQVVKKQLAEYNLPVKILNYDHNWDEPSYPLEALAADRTVFAGTAWHCYAGSMQDAQSRVGRSFPSEEQHLTECTGWFPDRVCNIDRGLEGFGWNHNWDMTNVFLGSVSYGSQSGIKWIMVLDEKCGPYLPGVHFKSGRPLLSIPSSASRMEDMRFNQDFFTTAHMARFIRPGAYRVESQLQSASSPPAIIEAFRDDAAKTMTVIAVNLDHDRELPLSFLVGDKQLQYTLPKWSTVNLVWDL